MNVETIYSAAGTVHLAADGSIVDALNNDFTKVKAVRVELTPAARSGRPGSGQPDYLEIDPSGPGR